MQNNSDRLTTLTAHADRNGGLLTLEPEFFLLPVSLRWRWTLHLREESIFQP